MMANSLYARSPSGRAGPQYNQWHETPTVKESKPPQVQSVDAATTVWTLYDFLRMADTVGRPREEVLKRFGFDERAGCGFLERGIYLRDLPSGNNGSRPPISLFLTQCQNYSDSQLCRTQSLEDEQDETQFGKSPIFRADSACYEKHGHSLRHETHVRELLLRTVQIVASRPKAIVVEFDREADSVAFIVSVDPHDMADLGGNDGRIAHSLNILVGGIGRKLGQSMSVAIDCRR